MLRWDIERAVREIKTRSRLIAGGHAFAERRRRYVQRRLAADYFWLQVAHRRLLKSVCFERGLATLSKKT